MGGGGIPFLITGWPQPCLSLYFTHTPPPFDFWTDNQVGHVWEHGGGSSPPHAPKHDPLDYQYRYYPSFYLTHIPPPPWEFLLISWDPTRWREVLLGVGGCCLDIPRDGENISWRGWGLDKSNWIPRDEEKWREALTGFENGRPQPTPSRRTSPHLVGSHEIPGETSKYSVKIMFINKLSL